MQTFILIFTAALFNLSVNLQAQTPFIDHAMPTDGLDLHPFLENPAINKPEQGKAAYLQTERTRKYKVTLDWGTNQPEATYKLKDTRQGIAFVSPLGGGAALGITAVQTKSSNEAKLDTSANTMKEEFTRIDGEARAIFNLTPKFRAALGLRYAYLKADIAGAFFINNSDRTSYKGAMTGYSAGVYLDQNEFGLGLVYLPALRGKIKVEGEELIFSDPTLLKIEAKYGHPNDYVFGASIYRWIHKLDDRSKKQESPEEQSEISLAGVDLEQWLKPTMRYSIGLDTPRYKDMYLRFSGQKTEYAFLFETDSLPGDDDGNETKVNGYGLAAVGAFNPSDFTLSLGYSYLWRKADNITDTAGWFAGHYQGYEVKESILQAMFNFQF